MGYNFFVIISINYVQYCIYTYITIASYIGSLAKHLLEFSNNGCKTNVLDWTKKGFQLYLSVDQ